jgi:two-component system OmpR family response regulator
VAFCGVRGVFVAGVWAQAPVASQVAASAQPRTWRPGLCEAKRKPGKCRMLILRLSPRGADHDLTCLRFSVILAPVLSMRILVVEDDAVLLAVVTRSLGEAGHRVDGACNLEQARHFVRVQPYDAILLDLNLPLSGSPRSGMGSGLTWLRELRAQGVRTPVMVLTARNRTDERIAGLDAGADDYAGKPFELAEVEARLRALVRRSQNAEDVVRVGALCLHRHLNRVELDGAELVLPAREFEVLCELLSPPGKVVSKRILSEKLSTFEEALGDNALEAFISRLRKKLQGSGVTIRTLRGLGYLLEDLPV